MNFDPGGKLNFVEPSRQLTRLEWKQLDRARRLRQNGKLQPVIVGKELWLFASDYNELEDQSSARLVGVAG